MKELDIAEVAQRAGVRPSTLRFYEKKGLIQPTGRHGLRRQYHVGVLQKLALIALGRTAGFTLDDIAAMFTAQGEMVIDRVLLSNKASEIDRTIKRLMKVRDGLRHVASCPASDHLDCPEFRKIMAKAQR
ncbi:helix-turn-helix domain-containing protein [Winslowiella iniecta]|uniref:MerR family transcriptional regulator n=1 Tax=Winslowiella iniecta TaxID=1560201 RepID=A0A0L7T6D3_9GAMM|nr:helix-turn-helix domain-containing protein [Winslowiella iniecta]KOC87244.1 MerR family transcriptional regulator [Winslowiella iniecta]KOC90947.1 MerR family transcriptional regulator [Winslowiella iniecta]